MNRGQSLLGSFLKHNKLPTFLHSFVPACNKMGVIRALANTLGLLKICV